MSHAYLHLGTRKKRFDSFKMKTRLFEFIADKTIQVLAYVDCDILFGIQGPLQSCVPSHPSSIPFARLRDELRHVWSVVGRKPGALHSHADGNWRTPKERPLW
jgi:hypothetical protein